MSNNCVCCGENTRNTLHFSVRGTIYLCEKCFNKLFYLERMKPDQSNCCFCEKNENKYYTYYTQAQKDISFDVNFCEDCLIKYSGFSTEELFDYLINNKSNNIVLNIDWSKV